MRLEDAEGNAGWGDVAPLPGYSHESMEDVDEDWKRHRAALFERPVQGFDFFGSRMAPVWRFTTASLRFGVEQALIGLEARLSNVHPSDIVAGNGPESIRLAGLVTRTGDAAVEDAARLAEQGYRTLKVKMGRTTLDEDIATVLAIRKTVGSNVRLRLDANRAWSFDEAGRFLTGTASTVLEFIEEPLADPEEAERLHARFQVPIALDETLLSVSPDELVKWSFATHVVLKPTLMGGIQLSERFVEAAARLGMTPVVSASYESGLGTAFLACLAARWCPGGTAAGLDTYRHLRNDVLKGRLRIGPEMYLSDLTFEPEAGLDAAS